MNSNLKKSTKKKSNKKKIKSVYNFKLKKKSNKDIYELSKADFNENKKYQDIKNKLENKLKFWHNILSGSGVTGDPALDDIINLMMLSYLDKNKERLDLLNRDYYQELDDQDFENQSKLLNISELMKSQSNLCRSNKDDSMSKIEMIGELLKLHPLIGKIIKVNNFIKCKNDKILYDLIKDINDFCQKYDIFQYSDIIGIAYEFWANEYKGSGGKELGNFFTERNLMRMCFEIIELDDIKKMKIDNNSTIGDEFCGTFGFPLYLKSFLKSKFNIDIKNENIYGLELEDRAARLAIFNAMFSLGTVKNINNGDSFTTNVNEHLDLSVHNVPFGKRMKADYIKSKYNKEKLNNKSMPDFDKIIHSKANKDAVLASQMVVYKTTKIGICIIKDGEEASGTNKSLVEYRKHICNTVNVKKILKIPSGAFSSTGTKTLCFYFIKDGKKTENIQFLELNNDCSKIKEICNVSYQDLENNNYLWSPSSYLLDEDMEKIKSISKCQWKKVKDIFEIKNGNFNSSDVDNNGDIPFFNCSAKNPIGTHSTFNINYDDEYLLLITAGGSLKNLEGDNVGLGNVYKVKGKTACMSGVKSLKLSKPGIDINYIYQFINYNKIHFTKHAKFTTNLGTLKTKNLEKILLPIPSIEIQRETVKSIEIFSSMIESLENVNENHKKGMGIYLDMTLKKNFDNIKWKKLDDLCEIKSGKFNSRDCKETGKYPFYTGKANNPEGYSDNYCFDYKDYLILIKDGGAGENIYGDHIGLGKVFKVKNKSSATTHQLAIIPSKEVNCDYLFYYLKLRKNKIMDLARYTTNLGCIRKSDIHNIKIPIQTKENELAIIKYMDNINTVISENEKLIELYKENIQEIIKQSYS